MRGILLVDDFPSSSMAGGGRGARRLEAGDLGRKAIGWHLDPLAASLSGIDPPLLVPRVWQKDRLRLVRNTWPFSGLLTSRILVAADPQFACESPVAWQIPVSTLPPQATDCIHTEQVQTTQTR